MVEKGKSRIRVQFVLQVKLASTESSLQSRVIQHEVDWHYSATKHFGQSAFWWDSSLRRQSCKQNESHEPKLQEQQPEKRRVHYVLMGEVENIMRTLGKQKRNIGHTLKLTNRDVTDSWEILTATVNNLPIIWSPDLCLYQLDWVPPLAALPVLKNITTR